MQFKTIQNGEISLRVALSGSGPLLLFVHGWPELWYSWRHQLGHFAERGFTAAAMDVRGYGGSDKPPEVQAYTLASLASDVAAIIDQVGDGKAVVVGHDWGAPVAWTSALLHPERVRAVAGMSVPYSPPSDISFVDMARRLYAGRFFYQVYFQEQGPPERELEADVEVALRKIYFAHSGEARLNEWIVDKPGRASVLDGLPNPPDRFSWLPEEDLAVFVEAFRVGGFRAPLNRYRAQQLDVAELASVRGKRIDQPACFVAGERDPVRSFVPGRDRYEDPGFACSDFRGSNIIPDVGHWVQQEAPEATNRALEAFLNGL